MNEPAGYICQTSGNCEANARLIAAAPDLLECLIHLADRDWFASGMTGEVICGLDAEKVRNALSKALGQNAPVLATADTKSPTP